MGQLWFILKSLYPADGERLFRFRDRESVFKSAEEWRLDWLCSVASQFPHLPRLQLDRFQGEMVMDTERQLPIHGWHLYQIQLQRGHNTVGRHSVEQPPDWRFFVTWPSDFSKTLVPSLHYFTYDIYFWVGNINDSQALEFDINQFVGGKSFIWGHECRIAGGHEWDTWNNAGEHWVKSGIPCNPVSNAWNHLTINVQRTSDNHLLFKTITLNGKTATLNRYDTPTSRNWYGVTVNYQIDSNYYKKPYSVYIDKFTFTAK